MQSRAMMRNAAAASLLLLLLGLAVREGGSLTTTASFARSGSRPRRRTAAVLPLRLRAVAVPASSLEQGLSPDEREVVNVVRNVGPSVAFVTSVLTSNATTTDYALPPGRSLGSGSAFVIDAGGYLCTNYHVVEFAHQIQQAQGVRRHILDEIFGNVSAATGLNLTTATKECPLLARAPFSGPLGRQPSTTAQVYVRIDSKTKYLPCRIVHVEPDLDIAVLKVQDNQNGLGGGNRTASGNGSSPALPLRSIPFGSSSDLLVGQQLIAIGNPFGLDNTVTTGVVSALNRELQVGRSRTSLKTIRNCIQSDCAINPGNSGGPLLNRRGQVVGVNTAIVSTSGSSAGIGFAVPSDLVQPAVRDAIRKDRHRRTDAASRPTPFLGVRILRASAGGGGGASPDEAAAPATRSPLLSQKNWITAVRTDSPAAQAGMRPLRLGDGATLASGDAVVAVGGNAVSTHDELQQELERRAVGEQVAVTLEDLHGDRRVVYVTLTATPLP